MLQAEQCRSPCRLWYTPPTRAEFLAPYRGLVDKHQPGGIKHTLLSDPTSACSRHIRSLPFGSLQAFF